ncbi:MAG: substrate-binding domain-containing protein [Treponema sp.]|nr:substrate-binding domain-containing protein [Treponema sp.]
MNLKISARKQFLAKRRERGSRVTIGFTGIADLRHFIALEYIKGMMKAAVDYDINFINMGGAVRYSLFDDINFISHYRRNFKFMKAPLLDGLVTWAASLSEFMDGDSIRELFGSLQPLPMVDIGHMDIPGASMLKIDNSSSMRTIMDHLVDVHHYTKFAFIGTDVSVPQRRRMQNFLSELEKRGLPNIPGSVVMMGRKMEAKYIDEAVDRLVSAIDLRGKKNIEAIVTASDIIASEAIEQLNRHGISVPKDVAVVGFNNWYEGVTARSPLTTVDLCYYERGYAAVEMLIDRLVEPEKKPETKFFSTKFMVRQSCGCFEESVKSVAEKEPSKHAEFFDDESEAAFRNHLFAAASAAFPYQSERSVSEFVDAVSFDLYSSSSESESLVWFQNMMQNWRRGHEFDSDIFHDSVSRVRNALLPILKNEGVDAVLHFEDIFHQMRVLVSVFQKYEVFAERENPYRLNNIANQSVNFTSASSMEQIFEVLRYQLSELDIPEVVLVLNEDIGSNFSRPRLAFAFPPPEGDAVKFMSREIPEPHLFPKEFFPKDRRYSLMLGILHHADRFFGYAFFGMKSRNIARYDILRMLLSNALYNVAQSSSPSASSRKIAPSGEQIASVVRDSADSVGRRDRISSEKITAYLLDHISEPTDVQKMASSLMVSKSYLSKKCKELTGNSVQILHEKLKIEQAKNMLVSGGFTFAEIACALGFSSQNYFSSVFKKNTGKSPMKWLKER